MNKIAKILSIFISLIGLIVILGWIFSIPFITSVSPNWVTMKVSTAFCFFLSGILLFFVVKTLEGDLEIAPVVITACSLIILLIMVALLGSNLLGVHTGIEDLFLKEHEGAVETVVPGRPSFFTMAGFILISLTGVTVLFKTRKIKHFLSTVGGLLIVLGLIALLGYAVNLPFLFYSIEGFSTAMAIHTALLFLISGISLLFIREETYLTGIGIKINFRLTLTFILVSAIPLLFLGQVTINAVDWITKDQIIRNIDSVASLKVYQLEDMINNNLDKLRLVTSRTALREDLKNYNAKSSENIKNQIRKIIKDVSDNTEAYDNLLILDLEGNIIVSSDGKDEGKKFEIDEVFIEGKKKDYFQYYREQEKKYALSAGPLILNNELLGVLVIIQSPDYIDEAMSLGLSGSWEVVIARKMTDGNIQFLIKKNNEYPAIFPATAMITAKKAIEGEEQISTDLDYMGKEVIASTRFIEEQKWGVVVKVDKEEAYAFLTKLTSILQLVFLSTIIIIAFMGFALANNISKPIQELSQTINEISRGNFDITVNNRLTSLNDEVGVLARSMDRVLMSLKIAVMRVSSAKEKIEDSRGGGTAPLRRDS